MRVIALKRLRDFGAKHPNARGPLREWYAFACKAKWATTQDVKHDFASASFVGNNRIVFNVGGNSFRVVVVVLFRASTLYVRFVGTHAEYDRIDVAEV